MTLQTPAIFLDRYHEGRASGLSAVAAELHALGMALCSLVTGRLEVVRKDHGEQGVRIAPVWLWENHRAGAREWLLSPPSKPSGLRWWER
jgi:hypothetical protein